jgi:hypothetical protein
VGEAVPDPDDGAAANSVVEGCDGAGETGACSWLVGVEPCAGSALAGGAVVGVALATRRGVLWGVDGRI